VRPRTHPWGRSATGIHLVDLSIALFGQAEQVWARLATAAARSPTATRWASCCFERRHCHAVRNLGKTPFMGRLALYGSQGWMRSATAHHPENPTGWNVTVVHRGGTPATHSSAHPAVRDNIEGLRRAVAGQAPYP